MTNAEIEALSKIQHEINAEYQNHRGESDRAHKDYDRRLSEVEIKINWIMALLVGTLATGIMNLFIRLGIK